MKIHQLFFKTNQKTEGLQDLFWDSETPSKKDWSRGTGSSEAQPRNVGHRNRGPSDLLDVLLRPLRTRDQAQKHAPQLPSRIQKPV